MLLAELPIISNAFNGITLIISEIFYKAGSGVASILRTLWKHSLLTFDVLEGGIRIKTIGYDAVLLTMVCCKRRLGVSAFLLVLSWQQIVALWSAFQAHHDTNRLTPLPLLSFGAFYTSLTVSCRDQNICLAYLAIVFVLWDFSASGASNQKSYRKMYQTCTQLWIPSLILPQSSFIHLESIRSVSEHFIPFSSWLISYVRDCNTARAWLLK